MVTDINALIDFFKKYTPETLGVEASKLMCKVSKKNKIKTLNLIFNLENSKKINSTPFIFKVSSDTNK